MLLRSAAAGLHVAGSADFRTTPHADRSTDVGSMEIEVHNVRMWK